jgi:hypothetical protein
LNRFWSTIGRPSEPFTWKASARAMRPLSKLLRSGRTEGLGCGTLASLQVDFPQGARSCGMGSAKPGIQARGVPWRGGSQRVCSASLSVLLLPMNRAVQSRRSSSVGYVFPRRGPQPLTQRRPPLRRRRAESDTRNVTLLCTSTAEYLYNGGGLSNQGIFKVRNVVSYVLEADLKGGHLRPLPSLSQTCFFQFNDCGCLPLALASSVCAILLDNTRRTE